jgi:type IV secretion system protein VirB5
MVPCARAQWAVVDVGAIAQLVEQISYWKQQIEGMTNQLNQLRTSYDSMTGTRGMERLLSGTVRNYLPADWAALANTLEDMSGAYSALSLNLRGTINDNAILTQAELARLSPAARAEIERERRLAAMNQVMARQALATTSQRFASVQQLIDAIPGATDPKAVFDLQARIAAEQAMLQNEQTKLQMLNQTLMGEELARKQRIREQAIADIGSFQDLPPLELP